MELVISPSEVRLLEAITGLSGGSFKEEAQISLRRSLNGYLSEVKQSFQHGTRLWDQLKKYLPYQNHLRAPGAFIRVHGEIFTAAELARLEREFDQFLHLMEKRGWPIKKTVEMVKRANTSTENREVRV